MSHKGNILAFLSKASEPVDIEKIRKYCGIGNRITALNNCLELFIQGKIKGQKTSKRWIFWTYHETQLKPWEETIGTYKALKINENEVSIILQRTPTNMKLIFPKNSTEANTLIKTLQNTPKGTKIAILKTDNPQKPLTIRNLNETTTAHNDALALLWLRKSILCVAFKRSGLVALKLSFWRLGLRRRGSF